MILSILYVSLAGLCFKTVSSERAPTWYVCQCLWNPWLPWSSCTKSCGGGYQQRTRSVQTNCDDVVLNAILLITGADKINDIEDCDTTETRSCNAICFHEGTYVPFSEYVGYCNCQIGWKGSCCGEEVSCGKPSDISHGSYSGNIFTYNRQIIYNCNINYNMTDPSAAIRTCTKVGVWSGQLPTCEYATSCNSSPCKNGANCSNMLGGYRCVCLEGWTGKDCEIDIQPPVVQNCPEDRVIVTAEMTSKQQWQEPIFSDPFGKEVHISENYPANSFEFPWGVFSVIYEAIKPNNGLSTSCMFNISVKPFPCDDLQLPTNGFIVCNAWNTDYTRICKQLCLSGYTYPPGFKSDDWYTCGASGNWLPEMHFSECLPDGVAFSPLVETTYFQDCNKQLIGEFYIQRLKASQFNDLCEDNRVSCKADNVNVTCY